MKWKIKKPKKKKKKSNLLRLDSYYKNKGLIDATILSHVRRDRSIIYGARALNYHTPPHLDKHTDDYDVYSKKPKKSARELEKDLDKKFGGDFFVVKPARYKQTVKVKSKVTGKTVADFTKPEQKVPFETSFEGVNYAKLEYLERKLKRIIADPSKRFRHKKDLEALRRIQILKKVYGKDGGLRW